MLKTYQKFQSDRLSMPKKDSAANLATYAEFNRSTAQLDPMTSGSPSRDRFLKKTTKSPNFTM